MNAQPAPGLATIPAADLGPTTEARFAQAFAQAATITRKAAAELLGFDPRTLDGNVEAGLIRRVWRGKVAAFTERDLRAFLSTEGSECPSIKSPARAPSSMTSRSRGAGFTARPARLRVVPPSR